MDFVSASILEDIIKFLTGTLPAFKTVALVVAFCLIQIDLVLTFVTGEADIFKILPIKGLKWGFYLTIIYQYNWFLENIINGAIQVANYGVYKSTSVDLLVSPFKFLGDTLAAFSPLFGTGTAGAIALDLAGIESIPTLLMFIVGGILFTAMLMALEIILIVIEYYLIGICGVLLIPFGCFAKTQNFAMRAISALLGQSFKILMFTVLLNFLEKEWNKIIFAAITLNILSLGGIIVRFVILYMLLKRVSAISSALMGGTGVSSTGSSAMLAGFAASSYMSAGSIIKSEFSKAGGFAGMMGRFRGNTTEEQKAIESYKNATGTGENNGNK